MLLGKIRRLANSKSNQAIRNTLMLLSNGLLEIDRRISHFCNTTIAVISSTILITVGFFFFHINPFYKLNEIAYQQESQNNKATIVKGHIALANDFLNVGQLEEAQAEFQKAKDIDTYSKEADLGLLKSAIFKPISKNEKYNPEVTEKRVSWLLELTDNKDAHAYYFRGQLHHAMNELNSALDDYSEAIRLEPKMAVAYAAMGSIYSSQGNHQKAILMFQKSATHSKANQINLNNLANEYLLLQEYDAALNLYDEILGLDNSFLLPYYDKANVLLLSGRAIDAYDLHKGLLWVIKQKEVISMARNEGVWCSPTKGSQICFTSLPMKEYYAYKSAAISAYLTSNVGESLSHLATARKIKISYEERNAVQELIQFDINKIQIEQPLYKNQLEEFRRKFL